MIVIDTFFVIDISVILVLLVLANLSSRIGEALAIPKYYVIYYVAAFFITASSFVDLTFGINISHDDKYLLLSTITMVIRVISIIVSIPVAFRYWSWLFKEKLNS